MALTSPDIIVLNAIWVALEATPGGDDFRSLVKVGNRIKETLQQGEGVRYNQDSKPIKSSGDLPEVDIDMGGFTVTPTMTTFGGCTRNEIHRQLFPITILVDDLGVSQALLIKAALLNALRATKSNFGIPTTTLAVKNWEITNSTVTKVATVEETGGTTRRSVKMTLAVTYQLRV